MLYKTFFKNYAASYRTKNTEKLEGFLSSGVYGGESLNRRVYKLPETSLIPEGFIRLCPWEGDYLYAMAALAKKGIVETGRFYGGSTFLLACANPKVPIYSIDIDPQDDEKLKNIFADQNIGKRVDLIVGDSQKGRFKQVKKYDFLFIDGDHSYQGCLNDLNNWFPRLEKGGHIILHDSYAGYEEVMPAVMDFIDKNRRKLEIIIHPCKPYPPTYFPGGSLCHLRKIK